MVNIIFYILTFIVLMAAIFPFWNVGWWWVRVFDFPRLQIFLLNLFLIAVLSTGLIFKFYSIPFGLVLLLLLVCLSLDIFKIYPYAFSRKQESLTYSNEESLGHFSIITSNVLLSNTNYSKILNLVDLKKPDLVMLLEIGKEWAEAVKVLEKNYPHNIVLPQENGYGKVLYSKHPFRNTQIKHLVDKTVPSIFTDIMIDEKTCLHFIGLHPRPPRPQDGDSDQRDAELMIVAEYIKSLNKVPVLLAGDLNDVAWSHTTRLFRRVSGTLDPRIGRGMFNTFNANSIFFRFPLDHFFHSKRLMVSHIERLEHIGSDHFPLYAKFHIVKKDAHSQQSEEKLAGDEAEAEELKARGKDWVSPDKHKDDPL